MTQQTTTCTAFEGVRRIASGAFVDVALAVKQVTERGEQAPVLIFDDVTSQPVEFDLRGTADEVRERLTREQTGAPVSDESADPTDASAPRGRGRPKLGVVAREVTLLPRHWDWLNSRPGGASVALRKLSQTRRSSFHLRPDENGLRVVGDIPVPVKTMPRIWQALRILEDLGSLSHSEGELGITAAGDRLLEETSV